MIEPEDLTLTQRSSSSSSSNTLRTPRLNASSKENSDNTPESSNITSLMSTRSSPCYSPEEVQK